MLTDLLTKNLDVIFFFYGSAFVLLGIIIFSQLRLTEKSAFKLLDILWLLGLFGLTHGASEFLDMFVIIKGESYFFNIVAPLLLFTSYAFLFMFGYRLINLKTTEIGPWLPVVITILFFSLPLSIDSTSSETWVSSARYFVGFTGALLCAAGFINYYLIEKSQLDETNLKRYFYFISLAFVVYGSFGGLVTPKANFFPASLLNNATFIDAIGLPVQLFRAVCAIIITWSTWHIINIFNIEANKNRKVNELALLKAHNELEQRVEERTAQLSKSNLLLTHEISERKKFEEALTESHKRFLTVLDSLDAIVYVADMENYNILFANKYVKDNFGEVTGKICWQTLQKDQTGPCDFCSNNKLVTSTGEPTGVYYWEFQNTVNQRWYARQYRAIPWTNNRLVRLEIAVDITIRKQAEETLKESEEKFRSITAAANDGIVMINSEGKITSWNAAAENIFGYTSEEIMGNDVHIFLGSQEYHENYREGFPYFKETGKGPVIGKTMELTAVHKDGTEFPIELSVSSLKHKDKWHAIGIVRDITDRKLEKNLSDALNKINSAINSTLNFDEIMNIVVSEATIAIDCEASAIVLRENSHWTFSYLYGLPHITPGTKLYNDEGSCALMAAQTNKPVISNDAFHDDRFCVDVMKRFNFKSFMSVPLALKGEVIGVIDFYYTSRPTTFTEKQIDFASKLSASVSLAIGNARLYEAEHNIADTLQKALLTIPKQVGGMEFGHLYRSATEAAMVGGDFYDIFELENDKVGIIMGDVSGKGLEAATLTSLVKDTIKALSYNEDTPATILKRTNSVLYNVSSPEMFITIFFGILDKKTNTMTYCNAGHPPAIIKRQSEVVLLHGCSPAVGAFASPHHFVDRQEKFVKDDIIILYTDGVTESRSDLGFYGEDRLLDYIKELEPTPPNKIPQLIFGQLKDFTSENFIDDIALLAFSLNQ